MSSHDASLPLTLPLGPRRDAHESDARPLPAPWLLRRVARLATTPWTSTDDGAAEHAPCPALPGRASLRSLHALMSVVAGHRISGKTKHTMKTAMSKSGAWRYFETSVRKIPPKARGKNFSPKGKRAFQVRGEPRAKSIHSSRAVLGASRRMRCGTAIEFLDRSLFREQDLDRPFSDQDLRRTMFPPRILRGPHSVQDPLRVVQDPDRSSTPDGAASRAPAGGPAAPDRAPGRLLPNMQPNKRKPVPEIMPSVW